MRPIVEIMFADFLPTAGDADRQPAAEVPVHVRRSVPGPGDAACHLGRDRAFRHPALGDRSRAGSCTCPACASRVPRRPVRPTACCAPRSRTTTRSSSSSTRASTGARARSAVARVAELGKAAVVREGGDVTIVATLLMVERALKAAGRLAAEGIEAEVIDLRWIRPLDLPTVKASVEKTGRLVVAEEQVHAGRLGCDGHLRARPGRGAVRGATASGQPAGRLSDPLHAHRSRTSSSRRPTRSPPQPGPPPADDRDRRPARHGLAGTRAGHPRHRAGRDPRRPRPARAALHRQRLQHGQPVHDRDPAVDRRRPRVGGRTPATPTPSRRSSSGSSTTSSPRRSWAAARPIPRAPGARWSRRPTTSCATAASRCRRSPAWTTAIWDLFGRAVGLPLHRIWGSVTDSLPISIIGGYYHLTGDALSDDDGRLHGGRLRRRQVQGRGQDAGRGRRTGAGGARGRSARMRP